MQRAKFTTEFKDQAVRQVIDRGHTVMDVAKRLGIRDSLLYSWVKKFKVAYGSVVTDDSNAMQLELNRLKAELRRTTEERDILKKAAAYFAKQSV
jgi:transposase